MRTVFLVPRRDDHGHRDVLWKWCKARWQKLMPDVPVYEGYHDVGPFNRSAAINRASELADADGRWDVGIVIDSDVFLSIAHVRAAVDLAAKGTVTWAHRRWRGISERDTAQYIKDPDRFGPDPDESRDMDLLVEKTTPVSWSCCSAVPRAVFDDMGGFDERFIGWGYEDGAVAALIRGKYEWDRIEGDIFHWWHPRSDERIVNGEPATTASTDYVRNALLGRRYMIAALRDHASGDQPGERVLPPDRVRVHINNLVKDDLRSLQLADHMGMPEARDWAKWAPSLDELVAGSKAYRARQQEGVALVVTSGGIAERWEDRKPFLRQTLASLNRQLHGEIVQRVLYADWPVQVLDELEQIATDAGFYVAGQELGHRGYTPMRQQLWRYLAKRTKAPYLFLAEDDFDICRPVDLGAMIGVLRSHPEVKQLALLRAAAYPREIAAGGVLESLTTPLERRDGLVTHRDHFTANPSLVRRSITDISWPEGESSERLFGDAVLRDLSARFAYLGDGEPWIEHLGTVRAGDGY